MSTISSLVEQFGPLAKEASERAYSPYSEVRVGAVVVSADGRVFTGCNVENASYGLTQCAERNALASAIVAGVETGAIDTVVVYSDEFGTLSPCGACRQFMSELLAPGATVISCSKNEEPRSWSLDELLPDPFTLE